MNDTTCSEKFSLDYDSQSDSNSDLCLNMITHQSKNNETMNDNAIRL